MALKANDPINIVATRNGFMVSPIRRRDDLVSDQETRVFQTMAELTSFLGEHFPHRQKRVLCDTRDADA